MGRIKTLVDLHNSPTGPSGLIAVLEREFRGCAADKQTIGELIWKLRKSYPEIKDLDYKVTEDGTLHLMLEEYTQKEIDEINRKQGF